MRCAVLSDIHGNLEAFHAVLADIVTRGGSQRLLCLGDVVGYGPDPHECIQVLRGQDHICVAGNHDWAAIGKMDTSSFNPQAAAAARWTAEQLTEADRLYLERLPVRLVEAEFTLVHGSPREPIWEYVMFSAMATENLVYFDTRFCLVGHTHIPVVFRCVQGERCVAEAFPGGAPLALGEERMILNPGGVGQPRDLDPRASYAILDTSAETISHYRVDYEIERTQAKMRKEEVPAPLILRLSYGR
ncbi:MAG: metallophosphoesterase family protein [Chloroflexi bacterium]|nr:metallophosphoesterase family protein [Chloroflexota bacterium]